MSTVWTYDSDTRVVWITMLALADRHGMVIATVPALARIAGVSVEATRAALALFLGPDPDSRSKALEGRRIVQVEGGWHLVNYEYFQTVGISLRDYGADWKSIRELTLLRAR